MIIDSNGNHHYLPNEFGFASNQTYNESYGNGDLSTISLPSSEVELSNQFFNDPVDYPPVNNDTNNSAVGVIKQVFCSSNNTAFTSQKIKEQLIKEPSKKKARMIINNSNGNHHYPRNDFGFAANQTYNESYGNGDVSTLPFSSSYSELLNQNLVNPVDSPAVNNTAFTSNQEIDAMAFWRRFRGTKDLGLNLSIDDQLLDLVNPPPPEVTSSNSLFSFKALSLQIGTWKKIIADSSETIRCKGFPKGSYFVWELEELIDNKRRKKRIMFNWSDIKDMKVHIPFNGDLEYLTFKLKNKPSLFVENDSPSLGRKHTDWNEAPYDFTDNQASSLGPHILKFKPGTLKKHYHYIMKAHPDPNYYRDSFSLQDVSTRLRDINNYIRYDDTQMQTPHEGAIYNTNNDYYNQNNEMSHHISMVLENVTQQLASSFMNEASFRGVKHTRSWEFEDLFNHVPCDNNQLQTPYEDNDTNNEYNQNDDMRYLTAIPDASRMIYGSTQQLPSSSMNEASSSGVQRSWGTNDFFSNGSLEDIMRRYC